MYLFRDVFIPWEDWWRDAEVSLAEAAISIIFVDTKYACRDKRFVATKLVAAKDVLSRQKTW